MKTIGYFLRCLPFLICITFSILSPAYAAMDDYCVIPPFVVAGVKPNVLLMLDNSSSTYDPVYLSSTQTYCYDNTYDNTKSYIGYFSKIDPAAHTLSYPNYTYNFVNGRFSEVASIPGSCTYGGSSTATPYVCINTSGSGTSETVTEFTASGRFLNWLAASKLDVEKTVLTGGKYDTASSTLIGESRGCVGRRFIRELPALAGITFAVRGPFAQEPDYVNQDTQGGLSRVEIYKGNYNETACQDAIDAWLNDPLGQWLTASRDCFGLSGGGGTASGRELATFTEAARDCYQIKDNIEKGIADIFKNVTPNNLMTQCELVYTKDCPDPNNIAACSVLNDEKRGNYLCSAAAIHIAPAAPYYNSLGSDLTGFVGRCWSGAAGKFTGNEDCVKREILHFCSGYSSAEVIDPSQGATETTTGNIPAIIIDAGARGLGDPLTLTQSFCIKDTARTCTQDSDCNTMANDKCGRYFFSKAYVDTATTLAPKGLIHEFAVDKELIRFGAMSFNCIGSASETVPGACSTGINYDAGKIIAYIGDPAGDHSSGLVKAVDDIQGIAWTPFSEAFYNSIGYYAQDITKRINSGVSKDFETHVENPNRPNPIEYNCQRNYVLLITDGMSTADQNGTVRSFVANTIVPKETANSSNNDGQVTTVLSPSYTTPPEYYGSKNLDDFSWFAYNYSIFDPTYNNFDPAHRIQHVKDIITTHVVYTGDPCPAKDALGNCTTADETDPEKLMQETAKYGGGTYQRVEDPAMLYTNLKKKFQEIAARSSSGTAASVLASGEGSGANLIQALFFPKRTFYNVIGSTEIEWTGSLHNFWYYIDPFLGNSSIREESNESSPPYTLNLQDDYVMHFRFPKSATDQNTVVDLYQDTDGDGDADTYTGTKYLDETIDPANKIKYLWEAGGLLWSRDPLTRKIYTHDGTGRVLLPDTVAGSSALISLMQAANENEATAVARYVKGIDVKVCDNSTQTGSKSICNIDTDCTVAGEKCYSYRNRTVTIGGVSHVWKLGDIVTSTPKIASWMPLNSYHKVYKDESYGPIGEDPKLTDPADATHFISTSGYKNRGMVFVGGNDGMLHAFKLGTVKLFEEKYKKAELTGTNIGQEMWAYIPKHALPYLKYMADPNYCHLYFVDLVPNMFDVSIDGAPGDAISPSSWRTVLIGGMRFGGACKDVASAYGVKTPAAGKGYSSYFALDITDTLADPTQPPAVLWEFSDEQINTLWPGELATGGLGFSTSGPALVRTGEKGKNGRWFVVFGSGPTGPIDTVSHQFKGYSDQKMKLFIVDLKNGPVSGNAWVIDSNVQNAFSGSLIGAPIDLDQRKASALGAHYSDDAIYFGYTRAEENPVTNNTRWTMGGVMRLVTKENSDPANWVLSHVIENIGPVTASVAKLQNHKSGSEALWLFYGTGRYYYKIANDIDNATNRRALYGIKDPCYNHDPSGFPFKIDPVCSDTVAFASLEDVTFTSAGVTSTSPGWRISLDDCTKDDGTQVLCTDPTAVFRTERVTTDPLATPIGAVFYTTVKPSADVCEFGGVTHLWAVKYDTGGALKKGILRGKALIQVSTGSIEEKDLATAFTQKIDLGAGADAIPFRRTPPTPGLASSEKPQIAVPPKPINRILHIRER